VTLINNVLILAGVPSTWQKAIIGGFIVLAGAGRAFCAGYDLTVYASGDRANRWTQEMPWDPMKDYAGMADNTYKFMSLF
ncbi:hypothetical protein ACP3XN_27620, partial [Salmonella enterica]